VSIDAEPLVVTMRVAAELERLGIEYLVGGSLASSVHGLPRTTQDVDMVARIAGRHVDELVAALEHEFYIDAGMINDAIRRRASFNIIHLATMLKVDIFVFSGDALSQEEMRRKIAVPLRNTAIWFASPEDIVLQKLDWYRNGQGISERQWKDVVGVIAVQGDRFDLQYARTWAEQLALTELLDRAVAEASSETFRDSFRR
jgi:hypothetical protein